jgi:biopolymer transport protein ExbB/TolQ
VEFLKSHYIEGGWGMHPILLLFFIAVYLIVERSRYLFTCGVEQRKFLAVLRKLLMQGNVAGAVQYCRDTDKPLSRIVEAGLRKLEQDDSHMQEAINAVAMREYPKIEKNTGYLAMLGNVSTLMGLLGTITGLIRSFAAVGVGAGASPAAAKAAAAASVAAGGQSKAEALAQGISEAMNCTAFGLMVGIMALLAFSVLNGRTQHLLDEMNEAIVHVLNLAAGHRPAMNLSGVKQIPETELYAN